ENKVPDRGTIENAPFMGGIFDRKYIIPFYSRNGRTFPGPSSEVVGSDQNEEGMMNSATSGR
ncbi:MAG: hypothetical protein MUO88_00500, partial [Desulfobacterales bacterium]|nr:hypothetical protein [Desulfobacterales bacterium]